MQVQKKDPAVQRQTSHAAVFVDYENLYSILSDRIEIRENIDALIVELIVSLKRHLEQETQTYPTVSNVYANFSSLNDNGLKAQQLLYLHGIEPRYVSSELQVNAVEIQLCIDAVNVLTSRPDLDTFVILTGNRPYLPLVQHFRQYGRRPIVASVDDLLSEENVIVFEGCLFLDALSMIGDTIRSTIISDGNVDDQSFRESNTKEQPKKPTPLSAVSDAIALQTLEIIEEHFGQYEEVYLTPLLRKLSDLLDEREYEPKTLISELEDCGAIRLEKRRGFPYDYTVLIIENGHPDVQRIQEEIYDRTSEDGMYEQNGTAPDALYESDGESYFDDDFDDNSYTQGYGHVENRLELESGVEDTDDDILWDEDKHQ